MLEETPSCGAKLEDANRILATEPIQCFGALNDEQMEAAESYELDIETSLQSIRKIHPSLTHCDRVGRFNEEMLGPPTAETTLTYVAKGDNDPMGILEAARVSRTPAAKAALVGKYWCTADDCRDPDFQVSFLYQLS